MDDIDKPVTPAIPMRPLPPPMMFGPKPPLGVKMNIDAWYQDNQGNRISFQSQYWVRQEEVMEVMTAHFNQSHKCFVVLKNGKTLNCHDSFQSIVSQLDGKR